MKSPFFMCVAVMSLSLLAGCSQTGAPSLAGHTANTGPIPAPNAYQANSAVNASTVIAPRK